MAILIGFYAHQLDIKKKKATFNESVNKAAEKKKAVDGDGDLSPVVPLDPLSLELGYGLVPLVDQDKGAELVERIQRLRKEAGLELGLVIPKIRIIDNMRLEGSEYCFKIKGMEVGRAKIRRGYYMCMNPGGLTEELAGEKTVDPAFGLPAIWIAEEKRDEAERAGYTVVDPPSIIATHITEIIKHHAAEILGRQETQAILKTLEKDFPAVVEEVQKSLSTGEIQKVLQGLLSEEVSIRNIISILEALADYAPVLKKTDFLIEKARQSLGRQLCLQYADEEDHTLHVLTVQPDLERLICESAVETASGKVAALEPAKHSAWIRATARAVANMKDKGFVPPVILCSEQARALVKMSTSREMPEIVVLSVPEIVPDVQLVQSGEIKIGE
jgi:flagellar biosynthesis protein FlhA